MRLSILLFVLTAALPQSQARAAAAQTDQEIRSEIEAVLAERHPSDTREWWRGLGPRAPKVILEMLETTDRTYHRLRLTQALGWFDDPEAIEYVKNQARDTKEDVVRNASIRSLGNSRGAKELDFISDFLKNPDPQTRLAAAETLQKIDDPAARERVREFMAEEKTPWLVAKLKGDLPRPQGMLTPTASSEQRLSPEWEGAWSGDWLALSVKKSAAGVDAVPVMLTVKIKGAGELMGELQALKHSNWPERQYLLQKVAGKKDRVQGVLVPKLSGKNAPPPISFEAELVKLDGQTLIEFRSSSNSGARLGLFARRLLKR